MPPLPRPLDLVSGDKDLPISVPEPVSVKTQQKKHRDLVAEAIERFGVIVETEGAQRARELEDLKFARGLPEDQWPDYVRKGRAGGTINGRAVAERPCLVINKLEMPIQQVTNEARQARLAIEVKPKGDTASTEGAELRQGMIRAIETDCGAQQVRLWALDRAVKCGRGYYRVLTDYANDGDFDLDLRISRILNQGCVYFDPFAREADWSDMEYAFVTEDLPRKEYERKYGTDGEVSDLSADELASVTNKAPSWVTTDVIRVAEYWYVEHVKKTLVYNPATGDKVWKDDLPKGPKGVELPDGAKTREVDVRRVKWALINAVEVLEERDWPGRYIPLVPVTGKEDVVDGERVWRGMVGPSKDAQRSYNYMRSAQVEAVGLAPKAPWVMAEGQNEGYEDMWLEANTRNFPALIYKPTTFEGNAVPPPQRNVAEPAIQAISLAVREAESDIKATTGRFDPSLGQMSGERSGRAIKELKAQGETSSSHYLENLASISMLHEARILLDLLPKVYDRPGRIVRLLGEEDEADQQVRLGPVPPGTMPQGPMAMPPGMPGMGQQGPMPKPIPVRTLDDGGEYSVQVSVGRAAATQREANLELITTVIEATNGQAAPLVMDLYAELLEGPMGKKLAKRFRKLNPQLTDEGGDGIVPAQVQAQIQQMQQQLQQTQAELQKAQMELATDRPRIDADVAMKKAEIESRERIAEMQVKADLAKTKATLGSKEGLAQFQASQDQVATLTEQDHDLNLERVKGAEKRRQDATKAALTALTAPPPVPGATGQGSGFTRPSPKVAVGPSGTRNDPRE